MVSAALRLRSYGSRLRVDAQNAQGKLLVAELIPKFRALGEVVASESGLNITLAESAGIAEEQNRLFANSGLDGLRVLLEFLGTGGEEADASSCLFGCFAFELIEQFESLPKLPAGEDDFPDFDFFLADKLLIIDQSERQMEVVCKAFSKAAVTDQQIALQALLDALEGVQPASLTPAPVETGDQFASDIDDEQFAALVRDSKPLLETGELFQLVLSRRFTSPCEDPLLAYRYLREQNPSPYMFYFDFGDQVLFGASPESAVCLDTSSRELTLYPIAGTRARGRTREGSPDPDFDIRLEAELKQDAKELAEHMMLVDLARNDMARVCEPGSRRVTRLQQIVKYERVMHLVSEVRGRLRADLDGLHAYRACANMGTLTGAPKLRAAEYIRKFEQRRRGPYGGAVGYMTATGDLDTAIVIRSARVRDGMAEVQAGAGLVLGSEPLAEAEETRNKAASVLIACQSAQRACAKAEVA